MVVQHLLQEEVCLIIQDQLVEYEYRKDHLLLRAITAYGLLNAQDEDQYRSRGMLQNTAKTTCRYSRRLRCNRLNQNSLKPLLPYTIRIILFYFYAFIP